MAEPLCVCAIKAETNFLAVLSYTYVQPRGPELGFINLLGRDKI